MRKLEEIALAEERKLELAEQYLEEDAAMFDEFLKENDKNSVEAIKIAEAETKAKLEKVSIVIIIINLITSSPLLLSSSLKLIKTSTINHHHFHDHHHHHHHNLNYIIN